MFSFFRKKEKSLAPASDFVSLINHRAEDFRAFYEERFGNKLNYRFTSLYLIDTILEEARISATAIDRKQWLAAHAGAYLYRTASLRVYQFRYQWYHPLEQPMMVVDNNDYRISLLAQQAVQQRLDEVIEPSIMQLYTNFEQAILFAKPGDDLLFV
jgi:hypothetical protein